jgi:hypothetical protein
MQSLKYCLRISLLPSFLQSMQIAKVPTNNKHTSTHTENLQNKHRAEHKLALALGVSNQDPWSTSKQANQAEVMRIFKYLPTHPKRWPLLERYERNGLCGCPADSGGNCGRSSSLNQFSSRPPPHQHAISSNP